MLMPSVVALTDNVVLGDRAMSGLGPTYSHFTFFRYRYSAKQKTLTPPIRIQ